MEGSMEGSMEDSMGSCHRRSRRMPHMSLWIGPVKSSLQRQATVHVPLDTTGRISFRLGQSSACIQAMRVGLSTKVPRNSIETCLTGAARACDLGTMCVG